MKAPVIGLTAYSEPAQWAVWQAPAVLLPASYVQQVAAAGGIPVLLPPVPGVAAAVARLDGLILTGGGDVHPGRYGESPHPRTTRVRSYVVWATVRCAGATGFWATSSRVQACFIIAAVCRSLAIGGAFHRIGTARFGPPRIRRRARAMCSMS